jgi:hypothetical protein
MATILRSIIETRINRLTEKRDAALKNKDYNQVWVLNMKIDNAINRLFTYSY